MLLTTVLAADPTWATPLDADRVRIAVTAGRMALPPDSSADLQVILDAPKRLEDVSLPVLAIPTRPRARFYRQFPTEAVQPFGALDLTSRGVRWRLVRLTTSPDPAALWTAQQEWLPGVCEGVDRVVVISAEAPTSTTSPADVEGSWLLRQVHEICTPRALALWIGGGTGTHEAQLPGGPMGELQIAVTEQGRPVKEQGAWFPGGGETPRLEPSFAAALDLEAGPRGWWSLQIEGELLTVAFHSTAATVQWQRDERGWNAVRSR